MNSDNPQNRKSKIVIPISSAEELSKYQKGLLSVLSRIKIDKLDPGFKEDLKAVYALLSHLLDDKDFRDS